MHPDPRYHADTRMTPNQDAVAMSNELPQPQDPVRKDKKHRVHPRPGALSKRPPPRPYKKIPQETLCERIRKLSTRMERAKKQVCWIESSPPIAPLCPVTVWVCDYSTTTPVLYSQSTRTRRHTGCVTVCRPKQTQRRPRQRRFRSFHPSPPPSLSSRVPCRSRLPPHDKPAGIYAPLSGNH